MHGMNISMFKNCTTSAPDSRKQPHIQVLKSFFFHKLPFGDIKLSGLQNVGTDSHLPMTTLA